MSDAQLQPDRPRPLVVRPDDGNSPQPQGDGPEDVISSPAKVLRIGAMTKQLLEEVRRAPLDDAGRARLREIYETSVRELAECLSGELRDELARLTSPFDSDSPSEAELRVAQAQLVGWLEGLFHGIQATLFTQQMAAQQQLEEMRRRGLPAGPPPGGDLSQSRPGTYL
ncbi:MAG: proteasome activator [Acidimicrobiales bacterium]